MNFNLFEVAGTNLFSMKSMALTLFFIFLIGLKDNYGSNSNNMMDDYCTWIVKWMTTISQGMERRNWKYSKISMPHLE